MRGAAAVRAVARRQVISGNAGSAFRGRPLFTLGLADSVYSPISPGRGWYFLDKTFGALI